MGFFEENSITGVVYLNTYQEIKSITGKQLDEESIEFLIKPIKRYAFVSNNDTIKAIKDKIRYYSKTYRVPTDRYINISNTSENNKRAPINKTTSLIKSIKDATNIKIKSTKYY